MGRERRIEYINALYHIITKGEKFNRIYESPDNINQFQEIIQKVVIKYQVKIHAIIILKDQYHLLMETPLANLSKFMNALNCKLHYLVNKQSLIKERYKAILINKRKHYQSLLRYICQLPLKIKMIKKCEDHPGSFLTWLANKNLQQTLYLKDVKHLFPRKKWIQFFFNWCNEKIEEYPYNKILNNSKLLKKHNKSILFLIDQKRNKTSNNNHIKVKKINQFLINSNIKDQLNLKIYLYSLYTNLTAKEISEFLSIKNKHTVSQRIYRYKNKLKIDPTEQTIIYKIEKKLNLL